MAHRHILTAYTGWTIPPCEGKDDHLDILLDTLAGMRRHCMHFTRSTGSIWCMSMPLLTEVAHYDMASFYIYHAPPEPGQPACDLLRFVFSKDQRSDLLQITQC
jgi:hypothetical protein